MVDYLACISPEVKAAMIAMSGIVLSPILGLLVYRKQREHEVVRERYLDNGVSVASAQVEYALSLFRYNHQRTLALARGLRDQHVPDEELYEGYHELDFARMDFSKGAILWEITNDNIYVDAIQLLFAFVATSNWTMLHDIRHIIKTHVNSPNDLKDSKGNTISRQVIYEESIKTLQRLDEESHRHYAIHRSLYNIGTILVRQHFTFKNLNKMSQNQDIKNITNSLRNDIEKYMPDKSEQIKGDRGDLV